MTLNSIFWKISTNFVEFYPYSLLIAAMASYFWLSLRIFFKNVSFLVSCHKHMASRTPLICVWVINSCFLLPFSGAFFLFAWLYFVVRDSHHSQKWFSPLSNWLFFTSLQGDKVSWVRVTLIEDYLRAAEALNYTFSQSNYNIAVSFCGCYFLPGMFLFSSNIVSLMNVFMLMRH